jgi:hypothetical protein
MFENWNFQTSGVYLNSQISFLQVFWGVGSDSTFLKCHVTGKKRDEQKRVIGLRMATLW